MKRKGFGILFALVLVISLSLVAAVPVAAADLEVGSGKPYADIAAAISAASDGDTIIVYDGTYGKVVVSKELTIRAAAGNSPVVDGGGSGACFGIYKAAGLDDVTIKGFEIRNATYGIWIYGAPSTYNDITLSDNNIHNHVHNGILTTDATVNGVTISGNIVNNSGIGISFDRATVVGLTVDGNEVTNGNVGVAFFGGSYSNIDVSNCRFEGNAWEHIDLGAWGKNPTFANVHITECQFLSGLLWCGVYIESTLFSTDDIRINHNNFLVGSFCGLCNTNANTMVDAESNWWGHASGPSGPGGRLNGAGKVIGQGDAIYGPADWDPCLPQPINHTKHDPVPPGLS